MRETLTAEQIEKLVTTIRNSIESMRKAKLLSRNAIMSHIAKNNAALRAAGEKLHEYGYEIGDTAKTRELLIWNEYLNMELERVTRVSSEVRRSPLLTAKPSGVTRIKSGNIPATTAFLCGK